MKDELARAAILAIADVMNKILDPLNGTIHIDAEGLETCSYCQIRGWHHEKQCPVNLNPLIQWCAEQIREENAS